MRSAHQPGSTPSSRGSAHWLCRLGLRPRVVERTYRALIASFVELELRVHSRESTGH